MKWVTREKARVDRIACPWLIRRFIDQAAADDHDNMAKQFPAYDALYAYCRAHAAGARRA